ncbi:MAG: hypothetical protein HC915_20005 [Anaerolineae bacterium]|nr:hypothetical protein [Anaerolineae bacterium]
MLYLRRLAETENVLEALAVPTPRQRPAEHAFSMVYKTLSADQKVLLRAAGSFAPGIIDPAALLTLYSGHPEDPNPLSGNLLSVLEPDPLHGGLRLHPLTRHYARLLLHQAEEAAERGAQHHAYFWQRAKQRAHEAHPPPDPELSQYLHAQEWARRYVPELLPPYTLAVGHWLAVQHHFAPLREWLALSVGGGASGV